MIRCCSLQYVVEPTKRASAEAFQLMGSHAIGECLAPYIIGFVTDGFKTACRLKQSFKANISHISQNAGICPYFEMICNYLQVVQMSLKPNVIIIPGKSLFILPLPPSF